jgi:hypothetical protein
MWKLVQLGWKQKDTGQLFSLSESTTSEIFGDVIFHISEVLKEYDNGKDVPDIAE